MLLLWIALTHALAGVTLNGVDIDTVRDQQFKAVDVYIDADGNVHLRSDQYEVQALQPDGSTVPTKAVAPKPATPNVSNRPARVTPATVADTGPKSGANAAVEPGSWWLATEDNASRGHEARVYINGTLVRTLQSGQEQVIADVSRHLVPGENKVMIMTRSLNPSGGGFYVYIGEGNNANGTVTLAQPEIQHGLGASRKGDDVREYSLKIE
ncbi:MAG: hypothetical protein AB8H79_16865 [Myxococcota bacterium]